ncbi:hypothetical protein MO867_02550 [Microbulbifer sp. OS29]|uniref:Uncharacterized protein n=1 Tax=Microbulbifer okhotskensis TaxID=2926617 RepID=A0A9X2J686_9GAMM|nr:hypothetical protein [Microbulbifer okhotskensis]MCO1333211.1 hypothetical protein [Microbulbifer okhotskensis]
MANREMKKYSFLLFYFFTLNTAALAEEKLFIEIKTTDGLYLHSEQRLTWNSFNITSDPSYVKSAQSEYLAIKCGGPWGAVKYRLTFVDGPGFKLHMRGNQLILQIIEYNVISSEQAINAMSIHCIDTEPKQTIKSIAEIMINQSNYKEETLELKNGYEVTYQYSISEESILN